MPSMQTRYCFPARRTVSCQSLESTAGPLPTANPARFIADYWTPGVGVSTWILNGKTSTGPHDEYQRENLRQPAKILREQVSRGELTTGVLAIDHVWPDLVELCVRAGLDYLIVDMEHGPCSPETAAEVCAIGRRTNFPVLLRPRANDYTNIRHAIDI